MAQQFAFHGTVPGLGEVIEVMSDKLDEVLQQQNEFADEVRQQQSELATQVQTLATAMARIENSLDKASAPAPLALVPSALAPSASTARQPIDLLGRLKPIRDKYHAAAAAAAAATVPTAKEGDKEISSVVAVTIPAKRARGRGKTRIARDNGLTQLPPTELIETRRRGSNGSTTDSDDDDVIPKRPRFTGRPSTDLRRRSKSLTSGSTDVLQKDIPAPRKQVATGDTIEDDDEDDTIYVRPRAEAQPHLEQTRRTNRPVASLRSTQGSNPLALSALTQDGAQDELLSADLTGGFNIRRHQDQVQNTNDVDEAIEQPINLTADSRTAGQSTPNEIVDEGVNDQAPTDKPTTATARAKKAAGSKRGVKQDLRWLQAHSRQEGPTEAEAPAKAAEAPIEEQPVTGQRRGGRVRNPVPQAPGFVPIPPLSSLRQRQGT